MNYVIAFFATLLVWILQKRYSDFVNTRYNTQAFVDPNSVPDRQILDVADSNTVALTAMVQIPMAQIASGFGDAISLAPQNPSIPPKSFGNRFLDTPTPIYIPPEIGTNK